MILINSLLPIVHRGATHPTRDSSDSPWEGDHTHYSALNLRNSTETDAKRVSSIKHEVNFEEEGTRGRCHQCHSRHDMRWAAAADDYQFAIWKKFCGCLDTANYGRGIRRRRRRRVIFMNGFHIHNSPGSGHSRTVVRSTWLVHMLNTLVDTDTATYLWPAVKFH